jgi:predicted AlkP superfamily phosphohydrolase/phosphomutase
MRSAVVAAKTVLVGVDGFAPSYIDRLIADGRMPALAALARDGAQVSLISTIPATTPVAWASLVTGAPPSVTGIEGFLIRQLGARLDDRVSGCYSHRCKAEPIWEAASRAGKRAYVIKFPLSYPSRAATFRLDGAAGWGGLKCLHEIASMSVGSTAPREQETRIAASPAAWSGTPPAGHAVVWFGTWTLPHLWKGDDVVFYVTLLRAPDGDARVAISEIPDFTSAWEPLRCGDWSDPLTCSRAGRAGLVEVSFRVKVLLAEPALVRLFNTPLHERSGHAVPDDIWQRVLAAAGPIEEQSDPSLVFSSSLDLDTQVELFRLNVDWLARVATYVLEREAWDLVMMHTHAVDWAHHLLHGGIDERHPAYDAAKEPSFRATLDRVYELVDGWIAAIVRAAGPDANVVVTGDHGQDVVHTNIHLNEWLEREGWLSRSADGAIDWQSTRAWAAGSYIYVNTAGRDADGIVPTSDAPRVRDAIVAGLCALQDPRDGTAPVLIAAPKEQFEWFGANGPGAGDVIVCFRSGYQATSARGELFEPAPLLAAFTSNHDHYWPLDRAIQTRLFARGPSFMSGYAHPRAERITQVAPTLALALGIDPPRQAQENAITALLRSGEVENEKLAILTGGSWAS